MKLIKCTACDSPQGLPSYKLINVPCYLVKEWCKKLEEWGCYGIIINMRTTEFGHVIGFWCSDYAYKKLADYIPKKPVEYQQLSLF